MRIVLMLAGLLFTTVLAGYAQKPKDYSVVIQDLASRLEATKMPNQPLRLAIIPFGNTQSATSNRFGDYVTESIIGKLNENPNKYKIFERKRLDAILKEDELMLSDMMLPEAAQKIGKLVPIDALFSGTYTRLKTYIDLSARLIDVTSGEILVSFSGRIKMTKNLKILFPQNEQTVGQSTDFTIQLKKPEAAKVEDTRSAEEICKERFKEFEAKLNNLSTPERINSVTKEAMKVPFVGKCGEIHFDVMYYFTRYKIDQPEYESFLISTLDTIALPMLDDRAFNIVKYLARDSIVDARDWRVGLKTISKGDYRISSYLSYLLGKSKSSREEFYQRVDEYFALAAANKIGLPVALPPNDIFFEMKEAFPVDGFKAPYVYEKYSSIVKLDTRSASKIYDHLKHMYNDQDDPMIKTRIMGWLIDFFNNHTDEKSPEQLFDLALSSQPTGDVALDKQRLKTFPKSDLMLLINHCRDKFSEYALKSPYKNLQEDWRNFCIRYGIPINGSIPSLAEADAVLKGSDVARQYDVMKVLVQMGEKPKTLENTLTSFLSKHNLDEKEKLTEAQTLAIKVLGNIKATEPSAINYMIASLKNFDSNASDYSSEALVKIGQPAVSALTNALNATTIHEGGLRYKLVVILGKIGAPAKPALATIRKVQAENTNSDIRYAIEAALETIR